MPLVFSLDENRNREIAREDHLALVVLTGGSAVIRAAGSRWSIIAPGVMCFGENDGQEIESSNKIRAAGVFFRPSMINTALTYENIRESTGSLSRTERQDRDFLSPFIERSAEYSGFIPMGPARIGRASALIRLLGDELRERSGGFWPCRSRSYLLELLFLVFKVYQGGPPGSARETDDSPAGRVIRYIQCSYTEKILVADLCRKFETNKTTLNKLMRETTGSSVIEYLNRERVQSACILLRDTGLPVQEIAYRAGFNDVVHFGRMFRKHTGSTPRAYREAHKNGRRL